MDPSLVYWAGVLLFFTLGLGLLIHTRSLGKRLVWLYLLLSMAACGYVENMHLNKQFLPAVFRDVGDVFLLLPLPSLAAAIFLLMLNAGVDKLPERWSRRRVSIPEITGIALAGHFLFRLLLWLLIYAYILLVVIFE